MIARNNTLLIACLLMVIPVTGLAEEGFTKRRVVYKKVGDRELEIILSEPTATSDEPRPAIVFFHGGGWVRGSNKSFSDRVQRYAPRGVVCAQVQYRFVPREPNNPPVVCIQDAKSAMRWMRSHAEELNIDPNRIMAAGSSAGGHLSAAVGLLEGVDDPADDLSISPKPNAMLLFCPVLDNGPQDGYGHERCGPDWRKYSPAHHVAEGAPPTLIMAGRDDPTAKLSALKRFSDAMQQVGNDCELMVFDGSHSFLNTKQQPENYPKSVEAFDGFLVKLGWLDQE
ncbi:alpha/beta hydrolase [Aeoliella sp. ICT_H6.2]|uniref:Alpha/beta hydrolase n=1 Tax=Aeoliella straminimaris TaxID=2954799 RepID=A0A9X2FE17_9BACT|nr:alpha/beta hydrolase [Aeoliella straminimaris]MCO6047265.1 alpha/beta hydrolase [Aeoliella straminimaris]